MTQDASVLLKQYDVRHPEVSGFELFDLLSTAALRSA